MTIIMVMKRVAQALFVLGLILVVGYILFLIRQSGLQRIADSVPIADRRIELSATYADASSNVEATGIQAPPPIVRIPARIHETIIKAIDHDLDSDGTEEQILILGKKDGLDSEIHISIIDYAPTRGFSWFRTWEADTAISSPGSFSLEILDLAGDRIPMLICRGFDGAGNSLMTIFRQTSRDSVLEYSEAQFFTGRTIDIETKDRPDEYQLSKGVVDPWDIIVTEADSSESAGVDRVLIRWRWNRTQQRYVEFNRSKITGTQAQAKALSAFRSNPVSARLDFLKGVWKPSIQKNPGQSSRAFFIDPDSQKVSFETDSGQEVFTIIGMAKTVSGLFLELENTLIRNLTRQMQIDVVQPGLIHVRTEDERTVRIIPDSGFSGDYIQDTKKASGQAAHGETQGTGLDSATNLAEGMKNDTPDITGSYRDATGALLIFSGNEFVSASADRLRREQGLYRISFIEGGLLLELLSIRQDGVMQDSRLYKVRFMESRDRAGIKRRLELNSIIVGVSGIEPDRNGVYVYSTGYDS